MNFTLPLAQAAQQGSPLQFPVMMLLLFAIMYFLMIRPQQRREKERKQTIANLKKGDRVLMNSGILGQIANVKENTFVVRIADGVKIEVVRGAISQMLEKGETPNDIEKK